MLRAVIKDSAAHIASWSGFNSVGRRARHRQLPFIAAYHRVVDRIGSNGDSALPAMEISVSMLEKHLDWIAKRFDIVSVDDLSSKMQRKRSKPLAAVTFDDGYADIFHYGLPLLRRKGIPAAVFVITDLIDTTGVPLHDRLYAALSAAHTQNAFAATQHILQTRSHRAVLQLVESLCADGGSQRTIAGLQPMSWSMLAEMKAAGISIGSHSKTHAFLTNESEERLVEEVSESRALLQERLNTTVNAFAYPGGDFSPAVVDAIGKAGYRIAFTVCGHRDARHPMLTIPRQGLWEGSCLDRLGRFSPEILGCHAAGMLPLSPHCPKRH